MLSTIKKILGVGCALLGSTLLVLSLVGAVGPGCGGSSDDCQAACDNLVAKCGAVASTSESADFSSCARSCRDDLNSSSLTASQKNERQALLRCVANAASCSGISRCSSGGDFGGSEDAVGSSGRGGRGY